MILSVIVPDKRPGMQYMLQRELQNIDSEVIYDDWLPGLETAKGDFVLLLERDSAVNKGTIERGLKPFLDNPLYRKLAMVCPLVEFDDEQYAATIGFNSPVAKVVQLSRYGCIGGAIIRRTSLKRFITDFDGHLSDLSYYISTIFWDNGLRVMTESDSIYYSPQVSKRDFQLSVSSNTLALWERECIS